MQGFGQYYECGKCYSTKRFQHGVISRVNLFLFQLYVPLNIFIALVGVVIWNESNEIEITPDADITLRNFLNYRRTKLVLEHPNDSAQLLTKIKFEKGVVGKFEILFPYLQSN